MPVHKSVHNMCKKTLLMHSYAQGTFIHTIYARVLHELCTRIVPFSNFLMYIFWLFDFYVRSFNIEKICCKLHLCCKCWFDAILEFDFLTCMLQIKIWKVDLTPFINLIHRQYVYYAYLMYFRDFIKKIKFSSTF